MSVCDVDVSGNCERFRAKIYLNDEEVSACANCVEIVAKEGHVEGGCLYYHA